jgi:hypothetical protein
LIEILFIYLIIETSLPEISKIIGLEWKKLTEDQKETWKEKAKTLKLEYDIEVFNLTEKYNG